MAVALLASCGGLLVPEHVATDGSDAAASAYAEAGTPTDAASPGRMACPPTRGDCNTSVTDGCETLLNTIDHCGGCEVQCPVPTGGTVSCVDARCVPACAGADTLCGADCVRLDTSPAHCGACERSCPGKCIDGACDPTTLIPDIGGAANDLRSDGSSLWLSLQGTSVQRLSPTGALVGTWTGIPWPGTIELAAGYAFVSSYGSPANCQVYRIDPSTSADPILVASPGGMFCSRLVSNGADVFVGSSNGTITRISAAAGTSSVLTTVSGLPLLVGANATYVYARVGDAVDSIALANGAITSTEATSWELGRDCLRGATVLVRAGDVRAYSLVTGDLSAALFQSDDVLWCDGDDAYFTLHRQVRRWSSTKGEVVVANGIPLQGPARIGSALFWIQKGIGTPFSLLAADVP